MITIGQMWYTLEDCLKALREMIMSIDGYGFYPIEPTDVKLVYRDQIKVDEHEPEITVNINICTIRSMEPDIDQSIPYLGKYVVDLPSGVVKIG